MFSPIAYYINEGIVEVVFDDYVTYTEGDTVRVFVTNSILPTSPVTEHYLNILLVSDDRRIIRVKAWDNIHHTYEKMLFFS